MRDRAVDLAQRDDLRGRALNLGTGVEVAIRALVLRICEIAGYRGPVSTAPARGGDVLRHCADARALQAAAGSLNLQPLHRGLEETWAWYRTQAGSRA